MDTEHLYIRFYVHLRVPHPEDDICIFPDSGSGLAGKRSMGRVLEGDSDRQVCLCEMVEERNAVFAVRYTKGSV